MARPSKPADVISMEKKSHRTLSEIAQREKGEASTLTGIPMAERPEVRKDREAHKEFLRVKGLFGVIGKDDDMYGAVVNRYAMLTAEGRRLESDLKRTRERMDNAELDEKEYLEFQKTVLNIDKDIQAVHKALFDIEKENIMTVASALRSIPKKPEAKQSALMEALASG